MIGVNTFSDGLATIANGVLNAVSVLGSPITIAFSVAAACLAWLALVEIHELDRMGTKPNVVRH